MVGVSLSATHIPPSHIRSASEVLCCSWPPSSKGAEMCIVRDGVASMQGVVGELARWQVREDCRCGLILTKFRAYPQPQNCVDA